MLKLPRTGVFIVRTRIDEYDEATFESVDKIFVNCTEAYSDLIIGSEKNRERRPQDKGYRRRYNPNNYPMLSQVLAGEIAGRKIDSETIFYNNGSAGFQFAAIGRLVYEKALAAGLGMNLPMEWFSQNIRN